MPWKQLRGEAAGLSSAQMREQVLTARAHDKILRIARTIADLEGEANVQSQHIAEAVQYRGLDRSYWS